MSAAASASVWLRYSVAARISGSSAPRLSRAFFLGHGVQLRRQARPPAAAPTAACRSRVLAAGPGQHVARAVADRLEHAQPPLVRDQQARVDQGTESIEVGHLLGRLDA